MPTASIMRRCSTTGSWLSSRRGLGPHHAQMDRVGTWDISRLAVSWLGRRSASGRRGAVADDARAREVGLRHSRKPTNKGLHSAAEQSTAEPFAAEPVEPRAETKRNAGQQSTCGTQGQISVSQALWSEPYVMQDWLVYLWVLFASFRRVAARPQTAATGQLEAIANLMRRTLTRT
jgi:hypothetical protein